MGDLMDSIMNPVLPVSTMELGDGYLLASWADGTKRVGHGKSPFPLATVAEDDVASALAEARLRLEKPVVFLCQAATAQGLARALDVLLPDVRVGVQEHEGERVLKEHGGLRRWSVVLGEGESLHRALRLRRRPA